MIYCEKVILTKEGVRKMVSGQVRTKEISDKKLKEKLSRHIYCKNCGFTGLIDAFLYNGPQDGLASEQYCPRCFHGDDLLNASYVKCCRKCRKLPAEDDSEWCARCEEKYDAALENERLNEL